MGISQRVTELWGVQKCWGKCKNIQTKDQTRVDCSNIQLEKNTPPLEQTTIKATRLQI